MKIRASAVIKRGVITNRVRMRKVRKPRANGRPRREALSGKQVSICVSLSTSELAILDTRCALEGVERSTLVRRLIRKGDE